MSTQKIKKSKKGAMVATIGILFMVGGIATASGFAINQATQNYALQQKLNGKTAENLILQAKLNAETTESLDENTKNIEPVIDARTQMLLNKANELSAIDDRDEFIAWGIATGWAKWQITEMLNKYGDPTTENRALLSDDGYSLLSELRDVLAKPIDPIWGRASTESVEKAVKNILHILQKKYGWPQPKAEAFHTIIIKGQEQAKILYIPQKWTADGQQYAKIVIRADLHNGQKSYWVRAYKDYGRYLHDALGEYITLYHNNLFVEA